jgi:hypothetical protein
MTDARGHVVTHAHFNAAKRQERAHMSLEPTADLMTEETAALTAETDSNTAASIDSTPHADVPPHAPDEPLTATTDDPDPYAGQELTVIGDFRVLPFADEFPLIEGQQFEDLVESIRVHGQDTPVELYNGLLAEGRNRVRAIEELKRRGYDIEVRAVEWQPRGDETIEQHVYLANVTRRHLTDDQRAILATKLLRGIRAANARRQAATRFGGENSVNRQTNSPVADAEPASASPMGPQGTTVEQVAVTAGVTRHKAQRAIALRDAVEAGELSREVLTQVERGEKPLRNTLPSRTKRPATTTPPKGPGCASAPKAKSGAAPTAPADEDDAPDVTEEEVRRRWDRFKEPFAITDHHALRTLVLKIVAEEKAAHDRPR